MIDKRPGLRIKEHRERLGLTQDEFAEKVGLAVNYISRIERGEAFPRYENMISIINGLEVSADAIFCDVLDHSTIYTTSELSRKMSQLPASDQQRILQVVALLVEQCQADAGS